MIRPISLSLGLLLGISAAVTAAPRDAATIARDAQWAQEERDTATRIRDWEGGLASDMFRYGAFVKADLAESKKAAEILAVIHEKIADALTRGDETEVRTLRKQESQAAQVKDLWHHRISEWRKRQAEAAPEEQWFQELIRYQRGWLPELLAYAEARKLASEAWGRVAEAVVPGADQTALVKLKEEAFTLDGEREIAQARFDWAYQREVIWNDKKLNTEELKRALAELQKAQEARLAYRREEIERAHHARELDRTIHDAEQEFRKAFETAQKESAERAKKPRR